MLSSEILPFFKRQPRPMLRLHMIGGMTFDLRDLELVVVNLFTIEILLPPDGPLDREAVINLTNVLWVEVITTAE